VRWPGAGDIAQWCVNQYKWMEASPDQYWMPEITKVVTASKPNEYAVISLPGRPRIDDVIDPLTAKEPTADDLLRGKPYVKAYINFVRKMRISLSSVRWTKNNDAAEIEKKKQMLASMKTNIRLVVVKK